MYAKKKAKGKEIAIDPTTTSEEERVQQARPLLPQPMNNVEKVKEIEEKEVDKGAKTTSFFGDLVSDGEKDMATKK